MFRLTSRKIGAPALAVALSAGIGITGLAAQSAGAAGDGVTAKTITIGATVPLTGIAATGYSEVAKAADAVFKYVNSKGGVNGRKITYVIKDDCYDVPGSGCTGTPNTVTQTQALLSVPVFATVGSLGTPTQESVEKLLKTNHVPQLFVNSGSVAWNNPKQYPQLFGFQQSYITESKILGTYMKAHFKGKRVCWIGQDDDFGGGGLKGLTDVGVHPYSSQKYDVTQLVIHGGGYFTPFIEKAQTDKCTVVFLDTIPGATAAALGNAEALSYSPQWIISSVGSDPVTLKTELGATPDSEPGAISFAELPASTDTNPWNTWAYKVLEADPAEFPGFTNASPLDGNQLYGIGWGVAFVEALRAEGKNVTRNGFVATLLKTTLQTPALTPLKYTKSNHEGLLGGYVTEIKSDTQTEAVPGGKKTVYLADSTVKGKVTVTHRLSTGVPGWLK